MAYKMTWLADVLSTAGLMVEQQPGWQDRGRGEMGDVRGILVHHTGGSLLGDRPSLSTVINGRADLPGPLSQLFLTRGGTWIVLAAGRCNHAGVGSWQGVTSGNSSFIGVEAENAGTIRDEWPLIQKDAYVRGCAAILSHLGVDDVWVAGHREYALPRGRKIDPLFDMFDFRAHVASAMAAQRAQALSAVTLRPVEPARLMLRKGDSGKSVEQLQRQLRDWFLLVTKGKPDVLVDGVFGPATEQAVREFQHKNGLTQDGRVGPKTWAALAA